MSVWNTLSLKIRRRESPFYDFLYRTAKRVLGCSMPVIPGLHAFLYREWATRTSAWHNFWRIVYYEPMFKAACRKVGSGFKLWYAGNGICRIVGNLQISMGDNVTMFDNVSLAGIRIFDEPELIVGDNTYIAPRVRFMIARKVTIGSHCLIGCVMIADNPGHPFDAEQRMVPGGGLPPAELVAPVRIGDFCLLNLTTYVYPGTVVGDGVVAKIGTHLKGVLPPFALVEGSPCRVVKLLPIPEGIRARVGEERYESWIAQRKAFLTEQQTGV